MSVSPPSTPPSLVWVYWVGLTVFATSYGPFFYMLRNMTKKSQSFYKRVAEESLEPYVSSGIGILPMESRVGDTHNIVLDFDFSDNFKEFCAQPAFNRH
jgi:hypothetical protein